MIDDVQLLRQYATENAEDAFAELVRRHVNFVYASALRQVGGNVAWAQDVTQSVFIDLARKAEPLSRHRVLVAWLFTSTRFAALKLRRSESRRLTRETEAAAMHQVSNESTPAGDWERLRTVIDEVLHELPAADREAVLFALFRGTRIPGGCRQIFNLSRCGTPSSRASPRKNAKGTC
jgi:DNA-directed RNA polymerase specialized sigma24 family protein